MIAALSLCGSVRLIVDYFLGGFNYVLTCLLLAVHDYVNVYNGRSAKFIKHSVQDFVTNNIINH